MKLALAALLLTFTGLNAFAGGSQFHCRSEAGLVYFGGYGDTTTTVTRLVNASTKVGAKTVVTGEIYQNEVAIEGAPDFGTPQTSRQTLNGAITEIKSTMKRSAQDASDETRLIAFGAPKIISKLEESGCRDTGDFVFTQVFGLITVTHTPKFVQPDGSHYRVEKKLKRFACTSSYATTLGGRCQDLE